MFKNIKVNGTQPVSEDILREINRGGWSTGYCGQSPERLKLHMANQKDFDLVTLRAKDGPGQGRLLRPAVAVLGHPGTAPSRHPHALQHQSARQGRRRHVPRAVRRRARRACGRTAPPSRSTCSPKAPIRSARRSRTAIPNSPMGCSRSSAGTRTSPMPKRRVIEQDRRQRRRRRVMGARSVRRHPARGAGARLHPVRQRQGARQCLDLAGPDPGAPRADLHAAAGPRRQVPDAARRPPVPRPQYRLHGAEGGGRQEHRQAVSADPLVRPHRRIRRRRRRDAVQPVARRTAAGHVCRDQSGRCRRARHQGRRLGLGVGAGDGEPAR